MENSNEVKVDETQKVEQPKEVETEKTEKTETIEPTKKEEATDGKQQEQDEKLDNKETDVKDAAGDVKETSDDVNAYSLDDLVTKEYLAQVLASLDAKISAVIANDELLKDSLDKSESENHGLKQKYEEKDFGNTVRKGTPEPDRKANETFDDYSKQFR